MTTIASDPQHTKLSASDLPEQVRILTDSLDLHGRHDLLLTAGIGLCGSREASDITGSNSPARPAPQPPAWMFRW